MLNAEVMELVYMYAWGAYALWLEGSSPFLSSCRMPIYIGESSKGRTPDFDSVCPGSNPGSPESHCGVEKRYLVGLITRR